MLPARSLTRTAVPRAAARSIRAPRAHQLRLQSTTSSSSANSTQAGTSPYVAGAVGGVVAAATLYGIYLTTPSGKLSATVNKTTKEASKKYQQAAQKFQESTPDDAGQVAQYIKDLCHSYVSWIPGGRQYVDAVFRDFEKVRKNHGDEVDAILKDAYNQFKDVSKGGLSLDTARRGLDVLADVAAKVAELGGDAIGDVLDEHPQVKEKLGGSVDQLRALGDQYGPEAKKQVDETWKQLADVAKGGFSAESISKAQKLIQEKTEQVRKLGDEAWSKGLEEAKPYLDKSPKVKELVEKNADALKQGNAKELFDRARKAVESGDTGDLEGYVTQAADKVKSKGKQAAGGSGLEQYLDKIPNGGEILPKLQQLREVAEKHTDEGEKLVKETLEELKKVLESKSEKAKEILEKAKQDSK